MMWEICKSNHDSCTSTSAIKISLRSGRWCSTSPFSSSRSWPNCPRCSLAFPPQWKPGRWGTFPDTARREDHSWWEEKTHGAHTHWHICFNHPEQTETVLESNSLLQSLPQVFEPPLWWDQLLQLVNQRFRLKTGKVVLKYQLTLSTRGITIPTFHPPCCSPAWTPWARSSWGGTQSCGWGRRWSPGRRCNCGDSGRCRPRPPISLWPRLEWPRPRSAGSLWRWGCWSGRGIKTDGWIVCRTAEPRSCSKQHTSLKCFVVLMMYGVFSFLSFFIQPCPKNSLQGKQMRTKWIDVFVSPPKTPGKEVWWYSLIGNDFKHQMIQQGELLCYLQSRVVLEGVGFPPHLPDTKEQNNKTAGFWHRSGKITLMMINSFHLDYRHWPGELVCS